nr:hypothetical protein [Kutzneria albida]
MELCHEVRRNAASVGDFLPLESRIWVIRTFTELNVPRRMDCRVMIENQVSIWLIHEEPLGAKWNRTCGLFSSHAMTSGVV